MEPEDARKANAIQEVSNQTGLSLVLATVETVIVEGIEIPDNDGSDCGRLSCGCDHRRCDCYKLYTEDCCRYASETNDDNDRECDECQMKNETMSERRAEWKEHLREKEEARAEDMAAPRSVEHILKWVMDVNGATIAKDTSIDTRYFAQDVLEFFEDRIPTREPKVDCERRSRWGTQTTKHIAQGLVFVNHETLDFMRFSALQQSLGLLDMGTDEFSRKQGRPDFVAVFDIFQQNHKRFPDLEAYKDQLLQVCHYVLNSCGFPDMVEDKSKDPVRRVFACTPTLQDQKLLCKALDFAILRCPRPEVYTDFGTLAKEFPWDFLQPQ